MKNNISQLIAVFAFMAAVVGIVVAAAYFIEKKCGACSEDDDIDEQDCDEQEYYSEDIAFEDQPEEESEEAEAEEAETEDDE